jgi:pSer/pThr/pTyr-binding forkhead associated (FHA) protein
MNALTLTLIRLGFLAVLWLFVIAAVGVVRTDLFGSAASARRQRRQRAATRPKPPAPAKPPKKSRPASGRGAPQHLLVTAGALAGTTLDLASGQQITIGRADDATLVLNDDYASTRHARLFPQDGQWIVEDLGSTNGTYLDRQKVTQPTPVPVGVPIRIGKTVLELRK